MFNTNKSKKLFIIWLLVLISFASLAVAAENYGYVPFDPNTTMGMSSLESIDLPFNPNDYSFLIYVPRGREDRIEQAMEHLGILNYDVRDYENGVSLEDLQTHDILIVGWNAGGDTTGLSASVLAQGVTGRIILSGHDADPHTAPPPGYEPYYRVAAERMLIQAIDYVLKGGGTGMITFGDSTAFPYLLNAWGISAQAVVPGRDTIEAFTQEGLASGVFEGLTRVDMSDWRASFHDVFDIHNAPDFVAFEFGANASELVTVARWRPLNLTKTAELFFGDSVLPGEPITYHIQFGNPYSLTATDVELIDDLPEEVIFVSASNGGTYDAQNRRVTWSIAALEPQSELTYHITGEVAQNVRSLTHFTNSAEIHVGGYDHRYASVTTDVGFCLWDMIYVDRDAEGANNGTSWTDAYRDLQDALADAQNHGETTAVIWIAAGTYKPVWERVGEWEAKTFDLPDNVAIYGHFAGGETNPNQRQFSNLANSTILDGNIDGLCVQNVVMATGKDNVVVDGITIRSGNVAGVRLVNSEVSLRNCRFEDHSGSYVDANDGSNVDIDSCLFTASSYCTYAIYAADTSQAQIRRSRISGGNMYYGVRAEGGLTMESCVVSNCSFGVSCTGSGIIDRCVIRYNTTGAGYGVDSYAGLTITNCWIYRNKYGIRCSNTVPSRIIRNNTIVNNTSYGIFNAGANASIVNCILWGNIAGNLYPDSNPPFSWKGGANPGFVNADGDNYHLADGSLCIDTGDVTYYEECDIDGEHRTLDGNGADGARVDKGADEYFDSPADFNGDDIVNFVDYAQLANYWLLSNETLNLAGTANIDTYDLARFAIDWPYRIYLNSEPLADIPQFGQPPLGGGDGMMMGGEGESTVLEMESGAGEIYLTCDVNSPDPNEEVTVYVHTDTPLLWMGLWAQVVGDANLTGAMNNEDCNQYGWDPGWNCGTYMDDEGWVGFGGVKWDADANGVVGYFKFRYNSGQVQVFISEEWSDAWTLDANGLHSVPVSSNILLFGQTDPNQMMGQDSRSDEQMEQADANSFGEVVEDLDGAWLNKQLPADVSKKTYIDFRAVLKECT